LDAVDALEPNELAQALNIVNRKNSQGMVSRLGQVSVATATGDIHSIKRLNDPLTGGYNRLVGADDELYFGTTGALTHLTGGFSGDPLSMVTYRPDFSAEPWMYVANDNKMVKVRTDGLTLPIGLPAPSNAATTALDTQKKVTIMSSSNTQYAAWFPGLGQFYPGPGIVRDINSFVANLPPVMGTATDPAGNFGVSMYSPGTNDPVHGSGYYTFASVAQNLDLSMYNSDPAQPASDEDYMHIRLQLKNVIGIQEVRIYFVLSGGTHGGGVAYNFTLNLLPGLNYFWNPLTTSWDFLEGYNTEAYVKSFSASDFSAYIAGQQLQVNAAELARLRALRDDSLSENSPADSRTSLEALIAARNQSNTSSPQTTLGEGAWTEFGVVGVPVRRGEFQRIGSNFNLNWADVAGIFLYVSTAPTTADCTVAISDIYMTGGSGPDTGDIGNSEYDYRYTNYDSRTGAEGNPSPIQASTAWLDALRRSITVTPTAYGDAAVRQKIYRRGGTLPTDWYYLGMNTSDGGTFDDTNTDEEAVASTTLELDNYQPVPTVNASGDTVLAQPLPVLWGPLDDLIFGCGDPHRHGDVYFCKTGNPDSWPPDNRVEVCSPSDQLMAGCIYGGQSFVFSQEKCFVLYPNLNSGETISVTAAPTQCTRGMLNHWALAVGMGGMYFVATDGIYRTVGGPEEWLSRKIDPLFSGLTDGGEIGYRVIDFTRPDRIRLEIHENELWFQYMDENGETWQWIYNIPFGYWLPQQFGRTSACVYSDEGNPVSTLLIGGHTTGAVYEYSGLTDDGDDIPCAARTGALTFDRPRDEKRFGDQTVDFDAEGTEITVTNLYNYGEQTSPPMVVTGTAERSRAILNSFGITPVRATNISTLIEWSSPIVSTYIYWLGTAAVIEPEVTVNRVTQWDDLSNGDESYLTGITFDCDTGGVDFPVFVETDFNGVINQVADLTVNCDGRHKQKFSWPAALAHKVRIRPHSDPCGPWQLFKLDWIFVPEPPIISKWDIHFENKWDQYYTGVDLYCDTFGLDKTIQVYVDDVAVKTETVNTTGRRVHHITLPWGRGHVFHLIAVDDNPGMLYDHRWQIQEEPSEQTNWNQNFSVEGIESDKYLKALVFQCDTFGQDKLVTVECDGVVVETLTINTSGRKVVQKAFPQHLGRVFRVYPVDDFPSRLYSLWWVFDQEPLALDRWETQEIDHHASGWHYPIYGHITVKSVSDVTLALTAYNQAGLATTIEYVLPTTNGAKVKLFVPFQAMKGILFKYLFTSDEPFWLYREETNVAVRVWGADTTLDAKPFGNDDLDSTRVMTKSSLAAARSGGGSD
jgi:hypothetical protein